MDNFTHGLAGWALAQAGLKRMTGLAVPTLIIAANLPDIDAVLSVLGTQSLALRRGWSHGPIALLILPLLLTGAMIGFERWQVRRRKRPKGRLPVRPLPLLMLAYIGTLSHPALDYMNNYGIRLLEPFSPRWFYGDTLFIIDAVLWTILPLGIWASRRREAVGKPGWERPAQAVLVAALLYIGGNYALSAKAEQDTAIAVREQRGIAPDLVIANPVPVLFWQREMLWRGDAMIGRGDYRAFGTPALTLQRGAAATNMASPWVARAAAQNSDAQAFLFWARIPYAHLTDIAGGKRVTLRDARFDSSPIADRFSVVVDVKDRP
ncbi:metal-dependent hydrolase [Blastomonas sp.]|uniref:metal-dependent hydrolase n=1 Tax=Blastomonas sp. TaxID=1909299 RepID=UPI0026046EE2|nr:metal-dependent hydrolase [Blastomonas sp.]MDM7957426.1 metal-dependent hydrolase [Blastomonas sp.]